MENGKIKFPNKTMEKVHEILDRMSGEIFTYMVEKIDVRHDRIDVLPYQLVNIVHLGQRLIMNVDDMIELFNAFVEIYNQKMVYGLMLDQIDMTVLFFESAIKYIKRNGFNNEIYNDLCNMLNKWKNDLIETKKLILQ